ncbi:Phage terminase large subunit (GpA) [Thalassoglobus neptunius]|uniref:Phage terminase large subunit (GpA) n=1 Tax=Thalassoglobus neptunius TaxID=1938619 RepID=A0A5C5WNW1_9PLAN|nr:terminase gpA endonuclease subunit [Thalassoglobus neptunius]TWT51831.1 Phage terminase large subunit (GpA) [Thalassoglobus neptunius]
MVSYTEKEDSRANAWKQSKRAEGQDVYIQFKEALDRGPINPERRESCRYDLLRFCDLYGSKKTFFLPWSRSHLRAAELLQAAALCGECFAFAMPRGSGKTSLSRWAVLWAIAYGHSPYSVLIGKTGKSAGRLLKSIKTSLRFTEPLFEDFPDLVAPIRHLKGETRRAAGQKFQGEPTAIEWATEMIVLASYPEPWLKDAQKRIGDWYGACSASVMDVCGIEGEIRGRQFERQDGTILRPTLVIADDPQDRESAASPSQCDEREQILKADVLYLAGPDQPTGVVVPCTKIYENDLADRLLDRRRNPEWQGETSRLVEKFPGEGLPEAQRKQVDQKWEEYRRIREESLRSGNKGREANEFYSQNQETMDLGSEVSWPERFFPKKGETSAIQHAMNLLYAGPEAFEAEYQNAPLQSTQTEVEQLNPILISERLSSVERKILPLSCHTITAFIDISENVLWWAILGWGDGFRGSVIDYGAFPEQGKHYFTLRTAKKTLKTEGAKALKQPGLGLEASLSWGLKQVTQRHIEPIYLNENGHQFRVAQTLIDCNWNQSTAITHAFCRARKNFLPSRGRGVTSPDDTLINPRGKPKPGEIRGLRCKVVPKDSGREVLYDSNYWKTFISNRLLVPVEDPSALTIFQAHPTSHKMFSDQVSAENHYRHKIKESEVDIWSLPPGDSDNHFFDCLAGAAVAASLTGLKLSGVAAPRTRQKKRIKRRRKISQLSV